MTPYRGVLLCPLSSCDIVPSGRQRLEGKAMNRILVGALFAGLVSLPFVSSPSAATNEARVNVGSPATPFAQNKQNEPGVAMNPLNPLIIVAGANDEIDNEACNAGTDSS